MLFAGAFSFLQLTFVPGFLILNALRYRDSFLAKLVYSFALSLLANYLLAYGLVTAHLYTRAALTSIMAAEWAALIVFSARKGFWAAIHSEPVRQSRAARPPVERWLVYVLSWVSIATVLVFLSIFIGEFSGVYYLGDDVVSWDPWAIVWAHGAIPASGYYPTLVPANWSLAYVMIGTTDVKIFGKAIMPLFSFAAILLFADRYRKTGSLCWLAGLNIYPALLLHILDYRFLSSGYLDIPIGFFGFLTFTAFLETEARKVPNAVSLALPMIFAAEAMVVKQGGLFVFAGAIAWWTTLVIRRRRAGPGGCAKLIAVTSCCVVLICWWWIAKEIDVLAGSDSARPVTLSSVTGEAPAYAVRFSSALHLLIHRLGGSYLTDTVGVLLAAGLFHPLSRAVFAGFVGPFFVLYALFFSYEARSFELALPMTAVCAGGGFEALSLLVQRLVDVIAAQRRIWRWIAVFGAVCAFGSAIVAAWPHFEKLVAGHLPDSWSEYVVHKWPPYLLMSGALTPVLIYAGRRRISFRVPLLAIAAPVALIIAILNSTVFRADVLVAQQLAAQRERIGQPELNRKLYEYAAAHPLKGLVATNYWYFGMLPDLKAHYRSTAIPAQLDAATLQREVANPSVTYLLLPIGSIPADISRWMSENGLRAEFSAGTYCFIRVTGDARAAVRRLSP